MVEERVQRRLAAILAADVVGYSSLMEQDETGTLSRLKSLRSEVFDPGAMRYNGRIFKNTGDGALAEFASTVDAVQCAVDIQREIARRNADLPEAQRITMRIGISLGDVIVEGDDLFGNGVNIAARMEGLAEPGSICVSGNVHEHIGSALDVSFEDLGEQTVKNIARPVRSYRVHLDAPAGSGSVQQPDTPRGLSDKASIAILPFDNISNDPEQEYFCDGVVEDLITEISKFRWLSVIARNSTFTYKGQSVDIKSVGQELGARYVVEGSVRKSGNRIRITAQLIESTDGSHVWAERYDRELADIFDLQDEITQTLVGIIEPELAAAERTRARKKPTENLDAWDLVQKASWFRSQYTAEGSVEANLLLDEAISLDPEMAYAYALRGHMEYVRAIMGYTGDPGKSLEYAETWARKAIALDDRETLAYHALGSAQFMSGKYDESLKSFDHAIELNPNYAQAHISKALSMLLAGNPDSDGIRQVAEMGMRLSPKDTMMWSALNVLGGLCLRDGEFEKAVDHYQASCRQPVTTYFPFLYLAATLKLLGRDDQAESAFASAMKMNPTFSHAKHLQQIGKNALAQFEKVGAVKALKDLGLPDE